MHKTYTVKEAMIMGVNKSLARLNLELADIRDAMRYGLDIDTYKLYEAREQLTMKKVEGLNAQLKQLAG